MISLEKGTSFKVESRSGTGSHWCARTPTGSLEKVLTISAQLQLSDLPAERLRISNHEIGRKSSNPRAANELPLRVS